MNFAVVGVLSLVLAVPAVLGLADHSIDPDEVGLRVLLAVAVAIVAEGMLRRFVDAVRSPVDHPAGGENPSAAPAVPHRRLDDPPPA